ncbi:hypothetical protein OAU52_00725 [bacterium]|nr:hypothetical protein [bacterium]
MISTLTLSCSTEVSGNPGSSSETTATFKFEGTEDKHWQVNIEEMDHESQMFKPVIQADLDSNTFETKLNSEKHYKLILKSKKDSNYLVHNFVTNKEDQKVIQFKSEQIISTPMMKTPPKGCTLHSADFTATAKQMIDKDWILNFIPDGFSQIRWMEESCNTQYPVIHLENDTVDFMTPEEITVEHPSLAKTWKFENGKLQESPETENKIEAIGEYSISNSTLQIEDSTHLKISPKLGTYLQNYSYTMMVDFMALDTGWIPLCVVDENERPEYSSMWLHTHKGVFNQEKQGYLPANFNDSRWNRLVWKNSEDNKSILWYLNGVKIGTWESTAFYDMDLLLKEGGAMYLFGSSESQGVPIQIKAIYNFDSRLTDMEIAEFSIPME